MHHSYDHVRLCSQTRSARRSTSIAVFVLTLAWISGCGGGPTTYPVREDVARETLQQALKCWQNGGKPEDLTTREPPIFVQDPGWSGGQQLLDFTIDAEDRAIDANLEVRVVLEFAVDGKQSESHDVWYLVGTDPVRTVFRDQLR